MAERGIGQGKRGRRSRAGLSRFALPVLACGAVLYAVGLGIWSVSSGTFGILNGISLAILAALGLGILLTRGRHIREDGEERRPTLPQPELTIAVIYLVAALIPLVVQIRGSEGGPRDVDAPVVPCQEQTEPDPPFGQPATKTSN